jgi:hypothetical protein
MYVFFDEILSERDWKSAKHSTLCFINCSRSWYARSEGAELAETCDFLCLLSFEGRDAPEVTWVVCGA